MTRGASSVNCASTSAWRRSSVPNRMGGLALADPARRRRSPRRRIARHEDRAEVVDVGERRPGDHRVAERREEAMAVVVRRGVARADALRPRARQRVGRDDRAGDFLRAVDAVGVAGDRVDARLAVERDRERRAGTRRCGRRDRRRAPSPSSRRRRSARRAARSGSPCAATCSAMPAMTLPTSRASPSIASPRIAGVTPASRATAPRLRASAAAWRSFATSRVRKPRIAGLHRSRLRPTRARADTFGGSVDAVAAEHVERIGARRRIGDRRPGRDIDRIVAGHIRHQQRHHRAGWHAAASRPPLIADRCRRTQFISLIVAPDLSSARLTLCLSSSVRPGAAARAAPSRRRRSARSRDRRRSRPGDAFEDPLRGREPAASGTGCAASTISIRSHGTA